MIGGRDRVTQIFFQTLFEISELFSGIKAIVLQKNFQGLSYTVVRLFSDKCAFLNFVLLENLCNLQMSEIKKKSVFTLV